MRLSKKQLYTLHRLVVDESERLEQMLSDINAHGTASGAATEYLAYMRDIQRALNHELEDRTF